MLLRPSSFMPFCTRVSSRCVPEGVAPSLDRGDEEGQGETQGSEETNLLAPVLECLRHHRIGQHGQERAAGEGLDEGDRFSAAAKRDRASTSPPRARTMRPRRSPDPWPHHPLERVWCSIRSGLLLRWLELHINRLRTSLGLRLFLSPPGRYLRHFRRGRLSFDLWWGWSLRWHVHRCLQVAFLSLPSLRRMHPCHQSPRVEDGAILSFK